MNFFLLCSPFPVNSYKSLRSSALSLQQISSGICDGFCRVATEYSSFPTSPLAVRDSPNTASKDHSPSSHHFNSLLAFLSDSPLNVGE